MEQILRTVRIVLAVLFLVLSLQAIRLSVEEAMCNAGGAWSIGLSRGMLILIGIGALSLLLWMMRSHWHGRMAVWGVLLLAGGLSNLYERISFGCVMDYLRVFAWFPVFNTADILLTIAVIGFLWENKSVSHRR